MKNVKINMDFFERNKDAHIKTYKGVFYVIAGGLLAVLTGALYSSILSNIGQLNFNQTFALLAIVLGNVGAFAGANRAGELINTKDSAKKEFPKLVEYLKTQGIETTVENLMNSKLIMDNVSTINNEEIHDRVIAFQNTSNHVNLIRQQTKKENAIDGITTQLYNETESAEFLEENKIAGYKIEEGNVR